MANKLKGVLVNPDEGLRIVDFEDELEEYYRLIETDIIEVVPCKVAGYPMLIVCDEEGRLKGRIPSCAYEDGTVRIVGNALFLGPDDDEGNFTSLSDEEAECGLHKVHEATAVGKHRNARETDQQVNAYGSESAP